MPRGRRRKTDVARDSRGKSRAFEAHRKEREADIVAVAVAQPHRRFAKAPRASHLGYPLGRLHYMGLIDREQHEAGQRWCALVRRYAAMKGLRLGLPQTPLLGMAHEGGGYRWEAASGGDDARRVRSVEKDYDDCVAALLDVGRATRRGRAAMIACKRVCVLEEDENFLWHGGALGDLRLGLNALGRILR